MGTSDLGGYGRATPPAPFGAIRRAGRALRAAPLPLLVHVKSGGAEGQSAVGCVGAQNVVTATRLTAEGSTTRLARTSVVAEYIRR